MGVFDGVHVGHQVIINKLKEISSQNNLESVLITFDPHPRKIIFPNKELFLLTTIDEKISVLNDYNIDNLVIQPFNTELSKLSKNDFINNFIINKLKAKYFIIGYNHHFGFNREASVEDFSNKQNIYPFETIIIGNHSVDETNVSSTVIRDYILNGDIENVNKLLNRYYSISGIVVKGNNIGSKIGFPTANIKILDESKLIPKIGVYAVKIKILNNLYCGMLSIGTNPTINNYNKLSIEVNIFNFNENIYNENIEIQLIKRIRDEIKFKDLDELRNHISLDKEFICKVFNIIP